MRCSKRKNSLQRPQVTYRSEIRREEHHHCINIVGIALLFPFAMIGHARDGYDGQMDAQHVLYALWVVAQAYVFWK